MTLHLAFGVATPRTRLGPLGDHRFVGERREDRERQIANRRAERAYFEHD